MYVLRTCVCFRVCICTCVLDNITIIHNILLHRPWFTMTLHWTLCFLYLFTPKLPRFSAKRISECGRAIRKNLKKAPVAYHRNHRTNPLQIWKKILTLRFSLHSHARDNAHVIAILHELARANIFANAFKSVLAASLLRRRPTLNYTLRRADGSTSACNNITSSFARTHCAALSSYIKCES